MLSNICAASATAPQMRGLSSPHRSHTHSSAPPCGGRSRDAAARSSGTKHFSFHSSKPPE
eukprot:8910560-Pyramimonas_sp.AAC.1